MIKSVVGLEIAKAIPELEINLHKLITLYANELHFVRLSKTLSWHVFSCSEIMEEYIKNKDDDYVIESFVKEYQTSSLDQIELVQVQIQIWMLWGEIPMTIFQTKEAAKNYVESEIKPHSKMLYSIEELQYEDLDVINSRVTDELNHVKTVLKKNWCIIM